MSSEEGPEAPKVDGVVALSNLAQSDVVVAPREVAVAASEATQDLVRVVSSLGVMIHRGLTTVKEDIKEVKEGLGDMKEIVDQLQKAKEENNSPFARFFDTEQQKKVSFDSTSHHD